MGVLRVYLALCVIAAHSPDGFPWKMQDGRQAVEIFYIISGFYMAMVLSSRYESIPGFYLSRFLRIFPPYWAVLAGTLLLCLGTGLLWGHWFVLEPYTTHPLQRNGLAGVAAAVVVNITVIGQDWLMFFRQDAGQGWQIVGDLWQADAPLWRFLLVPQAWSIGVELTFYLFAPYLNRWRTGWLGALALVSLAAKTLTFMYFGANDPWLYRFFPFEISLFIFGMLAYRLYLKTSSSFSLKQYRCTSAYAYAAGVILLLILFHLETWVLDLMENIFHHRNFLILLTYPVWSLAIIVIFFVFGIQKTDRVIGELSYPIYLVHDIILIVVGAVLTQLGSTLPRGVVGAVISVAVSVIFYRVYILPLDRKRHTLAALVESPQRPAAM